MSITPITHPLFDAEEKAEPAKSPNRRNLSAGFLSAIIPGVGQLLLGEYRKARILLALLALVLLCYWPLRLPRFYIALLSLVYSPVALNIYAAYSAAFSANVPATQRPSRWWLVALVPVAILSLWPLASLGMRAAEVRFFVIPSNSMEPTIRVGDRFVADMHYYRAHHPKNGEIVIFRKDGLFIVKRVIALDGQFVSGKDDQIYVDGRIIFEPYVQHLGNGPAWLRTFGPVRVPPGFIFVMGDNRDLSLDSRSPEYPRIPEEWLVGKPLYTVYSTRMGTSIN